MCFQCCLSGRAHGQGFSQQTLYIIIAELCAKHKAAYIFQKKGDNDREIKIWRNDTVDKRRMITCLTVLMLVAILAGIFCYISYVNNSAPAKRGTLVRAFSQKVDECCI